MDAFIQHVRKTDLARHTHKILSSIQRGQTVVVEHHGQPEVAIIDIIDYRIQRAFIYYYSQSPQIADNVGLAKSAVAGLQDDQQRYDLIISHYLAESINLNRTAELLDVSWLDLHTRFLRLGIPLRFAPASIEEARAEIKTAEDLGVIG